MKRKFKSTKKLLFEMAEKVDPTYKKPKLNENFKIWASFMGDDDPQEIDSATTRQEAEALEREYKAAYGKQFKIWIDGDDKDVHNIKFPMSTDPLGQNMSVNEKDDWMQDAVKKPGALHKELDIPKGEKIPMEVINKKLADLKAKAAGEKTLSASELKTLQRLNFAKNAKKTNENIEQEISNPNYGVEEKNAAKSQLDELIQSINSLFDQGEYEHINTLYRLVVQRGQKPELTMNEDHNPNVGAKVNDIIAGVQFLFDNDKYQEVEMLYNIIEKLFNKLNPQMPAPEME